MHLHGQHAATTPAAVAGLLNGHFVEPPDVQVESGGDAHPEHGGQEQRRGQSASEREDRGRGDENDLERVDDEQPRQQAALDEELQVPHVAQREVKHKQDYRRLRKGFVAAVTRVGGGVNRVKAR